MKQFIILALAVLMNAGFAFAHGSGSHNHDSESHNTGSSGSPAHFDGSSSFNDGSAGPENRFIEVNRLIKTKFYREAHNKLKNMQMKNTDEANRLSLLGFTASKYGDLATAEYYYNQALILHPRHAGALGFQGELFIQLGELEKAKENLSKLDRICWLPCSAERTLKKALERVLNK